MVALRVPAGRTVAAPAQPGIGNRCGITREPGELGSHHPAGWHTALLAAGLVGLVPALWLYRGGDLEAVGSAGGRPGRRARLIVAGTLAVVVPFLLALLTMQGMASVLGTTWYTLDRHRDAYGDAIGLVAVVAVTVLAVVAGRWALAGTLTAGVAQIAAVLPATIAFGALTSDDPLRWLAALSGVALGALVAGVRWRVPIAAALAVLTALILFIAYSATSEDPEKLVAQHVATPAVLILILCAAVAGAVAPVTAPPTAAQRTRMSTEGTATCWAANFSGSPVVAS